MASIDIVPSEGNMNKTALAIANQLKGGDLQGVMREVQGIQMDMQRWGTAEPAEYMKQLVRKVDAIQAMHRDNIDSQFGTLEITFSGESTVVISKRGKGGGISIDPVLERIEVKQPVRD